VLNLRLFALLGICSLFSCTASMADEFNLTATGTGVDITAIIDGTQSATPGVFYLTDFSGLVNGQSASLLPTSGPGVLTTSNFVGGFAVIFDNVLNLNQPYFDDIGGLGLMLADGNIGNIFFNDVNYRYIEFSNNTPPIRENVNVTVTPIAAPESASLFLLGIGLFGLCTMTVRGKMRTV
jgi:hypothetical protein